MNLSTLSPTEKGQLPKAKRLSVPIRLRLEDHNELREIADNEQRSMGFVAMRRYLKGREIELKEQN